MPHHALTSTGSRTTDTHAPEANICRSHNGQVTTRNRAPAVRICIHQLTAPASQNVPQLPSRAQPTHEARAGALRVGQAKPGSGFCWGRKHDSPFAPPAGS